VVSHKRSGKLIIFKKKRRQNYRRRIITGSNSRFENHRYQGLREATMPIIKQADHHVTVRDSPGRRLGVKLYGGEKVYGRQHHHPPARTVFYPAKMSAWAAITPSSQSRTAWCVFARRMAPDLRFRRSGESGGQVTRHPQRGRGSSYEIPRSRENLS